MELRFPITTDLLAVISFVVKELRSCLQEACASTIPQIRALSCLERNQGSLRQYELAEMLELSPSATAFLVNRMEEEGLIRKSIDRNNRRTVRIGLSHTGSELAKQGYEVSRMVLEELTTPLGHFLKEVVVRGLAAYEDNYLSQAKTRRYLSDGSLLNTLILYENRLNEVLREFTLSNTEFRVLFELVSSSDDLCIGDLARSLLTKISDTTVACNKLQGNGYILRWQNHLDRRAVDIEITEKGYVKILQAAPRVDTVFVKAASTLGSKDREMELKVTRIIAKHQRKRFRV